MNKGIIIEGADQSGKSELAKKLATEFGLCTIHYGPPKNVKNYMFEYIWPLFLVDRKFIIDRSYLSEIVYGRLFRNTNKLIDIRKEIEAVFESGSYGMILCHREKFNQFNMVDRDELFDYEQILKVRTEFLKEFPLVEIPKIKFDPFVESMDKIYKFIREEIK